MTTTLTVGGRLRPKRATTLVLSFLTILIWSGRPLVVLTASTLDAWTIHLSIQRVANQSHDCAAPRTELVTLLSAMMR